MAFRGQKLGIFQQKAILILAFVKIFLSNCLSRNPYKLMLFRPKWHHMHLVSDGYNL